jgi:hypothetical protein
MHYLLVVLITQLHITNSWYPVRNILIVVALPRTLASLVLPTARRLEAGVLLVFLCHVSRVLCVVVVVCGCVVGTSKSICWMHRPQIRIHTLTTSQIELPKVGFRYHSLTVWPEICQ